MTFGKTICYPVLVCPEISGRSTPATLIAKAQFGAVDDIVEPLAYLIAGDPNPQTRLLAVRALFFVRSNPEARAALDLAAGDADSAVRAQGQRILHSTDPP